MPSLWPQADARAGAGHGAGVRPHRAGCYGKSHIATKSTTYAPISEFRHRGAADGVAAMKRVFVLAHDQARANAAYEVQMAPTGYVVTVSEPTRSTDQNAAQWPILEAFSQQLQWPVNGRMVQMTPEEWKDVLTAAFHRETARLAMGLDGGVVMLGQRTSKFSRKQFGEWLEFLHSTAIERGVEVYEREAA